MAGFSGFGFSAESRACFDFATNAFFIGDGRLSRRSCVIFSTMGCLPGSPMDRSWRRWAETGTLRRIGRMAPFFDDFGASKALRGMADWLCHLRLGHFRLSEASSSVGAARNNRRTAARARIPNPDHSKFPSQLKLASQFPISRRKLRPNLALSFQRLVSKTR